MIHVAAVAKVSLALVAGLAFAEPHPNDDHEPDERAAERYRSEAEQGDAHAQTALGLAYQTGQGVARDDGEAVVWYRRAAEQGHAEAQWRLCEAYAGGQGGRVFDGVAKSEVVLAKTTAELLGDSVEDALGMALAYIPDTTAGRAGGTLAATVVGVVEDIAYDPAYETPRRVFYQVVEDPGNGLFVVRDVGGGAEVVNQLQQHPDIEDAYRIGTVAEMFGELVLAQRSAEVVLALAAVLALALALAGVAFSLAKEMSGSSHAIGVRLALGATPRDITTRFCTRPISELLLVVAVIAAVAFLGKLAAPAFMSFLELWLVSIVIPVLAAVVVLVVLWLAKRMAKVGSTYSLLAAR